MARIGDFVEAAPPMAPEAFGAEAFDRFQAEPDTLVIAVVDAEGRPVGLIERNALFLKDCFGLTAPVARGADRAIVRRRALTVHHARLGPLAIPRPRRGDRPAAADLAPGANRRDVRA